MAAPEAAGEIKNVVERVSGKQFIKGPGLAFVRNH